MHGVAPDGAIYVADRGAAAIRTVAADGTVKTLPGLAGALVAPSDLVVAADGSNNRIRRISAP